MAGVGKTGSQGCKQEERKTPKPFPRFWLPLIPNLLAVLTPLFPTKISSVPMRKILNAKKINLSVDSQKSPWWTFPQGVSFVGKRPWTFHKTNYSNCLTGDSGEFHSSPSVPSCTESSIRKRWIRALISQHPKAQRSSL